MKGADNNNPLSKLTDMMKDVKAYEEKAQNLDQASLGDSNQQITGAAKELLEARKTILRTHGIDPETKTPDDVTEMMKGALGFFFPIMGVQRENEVAQLQMLNKKPVKESITEARRVLWNATQIYREATDQQAKAAMAIALGDNSDATARQVVNATATARIANVVMMGMAEYVGGA